MHFCFIMQICFTPIGGDNSRKTNSLHAASLSDIDFRFNLIAAGRFVIIVQDSTTTHQILFRYVVGTKIKVIYFELNYLCAV